MKYSIQIDYTGNDEKAGKLTITDNKGATILNKVAVALPSNIIDGSQEAVSQGMTLEIKDTKTKKNLLGDGDYEAVSKRFQLMGLDTVAMTNLNLAFIPNIPLGNSKEKLNSTKDAFVLHENDFLKLKQIANEKSFDFNNRNDFDLTLTKRMFLWFPESINNSKSHISIVSAVNDLLKKEVSAEINTTVKQKSESKGSTEFTKKDPAKNKAEEILKSGKNNAQTSKEQEERARRQRALDEEERLRQEQIRRDDERRRQDDYRRSNDIDALDIILMYNNPELAPIFKPNSMLAWAAYFNAQDVNHSSVRECVNTVPGFEKVESSDIKYTTSGYSVAMYEDEQKTKLIGTLVHNSEDNSYVMESSSGSKTTSMSFDSNGDAKGSVIGEKGTTNFDLIQNPSGGYSGNWESESSEGVKISSGVSLSDDLSSTSTPFEPVNMNSAISSRDTYVETMKYEPEPEKAPRWDPPPPPPPPPPPEDTKWSSTNDSYNSNSFSP